MNVDFNQTVFEKMRNKRIPDYYDTMYLDGYEPWEIIEAAHNSIMKQHMAVQAEKAPDAPDMPMGVNFKAEVKTK